MTGKIPSSKPNASIDFVDAIIKLHDIEGSNFVGVMVRDFFTHPQTTRGDYNDAFFWRDLKSGLFLQFNANSDPSIYQEAVATIKSNQVCWYKQGLHGISGPSPYMAFRQCRPITVVRDGEGDDTGIFYTDLHKGGVYGTSSLGCLTIPPIQWDDCKKSGYDGMDRNNQSEVPVIVAEY